LKRTTILALMMILLLPILALPQKRSPSKTQKRPAATPTPAPDLRLAAAEVAEQLKLLTRFIYVYGKVSNGLETADEQAKRGQLNQALLDQTKQSKAQLVSSISNLRPGLEKLEQNFHANPRLQLHYLKLTGASETIAQAAQLAAQDRFDEAGRVLLSAADRLAEVLVAVR
jgi:hypothetical protein